MLKPGPLSQYTEYDMVRTLLLISEKPCGRNKLVQLLDLREASTRSLMKQLIMLKLAKESTLGLELTASGKEFVNGLKKKIDGPKNIIGYVALSVKKTANCVKIGLEQRDAAVRAGANGALVFVYRNGELEMPGAEGLEKELATEILDNFELAENDVVVAAFAESSRNAGSGAWAAVKTLLGKTI